MLSDFIAKSYKSVIEIALWLSLLAALFGGGNVGGFWGLITAFVVWVVVASVIFGFFVTVIDIKNSLSKIEEHITHNSPKVLYDIKESVKKIEEHNSADSQKENESVEPIKDKRTE